MNKIKQHKLIHKETFFQPADDGMPSTWVVQFYTDNGNGFPDAQYFATEKEARAFESDLAGNFTKMVDDTFWDLM